MDFSKCINIKKVLAKDAFHRCLNGTIMDPNATELPLQCQTDEYIESIDESGITKIFQKLGDTNRFDDPDDTIIIDSMVDSKV